eukprot:7583234-Pyramimonas_sp.AAC.1
MDRMRVEAVLARPPAPPLPVRGTFIHFEGSKNAGSERRALSMPPRAGIVYVLGAEKHSSGVAPLLAAAAGAAPASPDF